MPTDWEAQYISKDMPWEKGAPHPALVDYLAENDVRGRVLVPGCGTGHDVRALAAHGAVPVGLDIAPSAIAAAQSTPPAGAETYALGDFFAPQPELVGAFDWVFEHTCFCAIDLSQRAAYVESAHAVLKPGGQLLAIFYLDPGNDSPDEGPPFEVSIAELDRLFLPRFELLQEWLPAQTYSGREGREWMRILRRRA
jgi:SAM-dependent methyltransferase